MTAKLHTHTSSFYETVAGNSECVVSVGTEAGAGVDDDSMVGD